MFVKQEYSVFTMIRWPIFLNGGQLYKFHKLDHATMFFRLCTCLLDNLVEFHSRNNKCFILQEYELKLNIWSIHDEALVETITMNIWNTGGSSFHESDPNMSRYFHHIWLGFSINGKGCVQLPIYTSLQPNQLINHYFMFLRVRVNVPLILSRIPLLPLTHLHCC
jgi:hypothetical protein